MLERSRKVVLLIDYDNLQICASRDTPGRELQLVPVVQLAQRYGTVVLARAYAEWNLSTERLAVYKAGIEPAFAPVLRTESDRSGKSLADTVMVAEGMDMLWTLAPDVVVLATSDKDLIPLVRVAKQRGAFVVVLGSDFTAIPLREMADEHVTYKQLITDSAGRYTTEAGPARQPAALPEPSRRRTRDRTGRESRTAAATSAGTAPSRNEREAAPRAERETAAAAASAAAEPVAPVTAGTAGESDGQISSRRRRRRGSRRRSERLGSTSEGGPGSDSAELSEEASPEATSTDVTDIAQASGGTVEAEAPANSFDAGIPEAPPQAAPEPRERRRRTRRSTSTAARSAATEIPASEAEITPTTPAPPDETTAAGTNGTAPPEAGSEETPRPRRRRVAGAARGRSR